MTEFWLKKSMDSFYGTKNLSLLNKKIGFDRLIEKEVLFLKRKTTIKVKIYKNSVLIIIIQFFFLNQ